MTHVAICQESLFAERLDMDGSANDELAERSYERLRRMLDRAGLSNREVADKLEVAPETVSRWRSGQQEARGRDLRAIIALLAAHGIVVSEQWLRTGIASAELEGAPVSAGVPAKKTGVHKRRPA